MGKTIRKRKPIDETDIVENNNVVVKYTDHNGRKIKAVFPSKEHAHTLLHHLSHNDIPHTVE